MNNKENSFSYPDKQWYYHTLDKKIQEEEENTKDD